MVLGLLYNKNASISQGEVIMDEDTKVTVPPTASAEAAPVVLTQTELDAKAAQEKAKADAAAAEQYIADRKTAELGCMQSQIAYNNAATYAAWGIGIGAVLAGTGILIYSLKS